MDVSVGLRDGRAGGFVDMPGCRHCNAAHADGGTGIRSTGDRARSRPGEAGCRMREYWRRIWEVIENQGTDQAVETGQQDSALPKIWVLGKTGAGKSSLVGMLTGASEIGIGNGFEPCTTQSRLYGYPQEAPVLHYLDTRGIGESGYDPASEIAAHSGTCSAILAVARLNDPAQGELCRAVREVRRTRPGRKIILVHSWAGAFADMTRRELAREVNQAAIERAAGRRLPGAVVETRNPGNGDEDRDRLLQLLGHELPLVAFLLARQGGATTESEEFAAIHASVSRYSLSAGLAALIPFAGPASTIPIQGSMLVELARHYEVDLNRNLLASLASMLGVAVIGRAVATKAVAMVPAFGQTAGAVLNGTAAFATTFALGRATGYYLFHLKAGKRPDKREVRQIYKNALRGARHAFRKDVGAGD